MNIIKQNAQYMERNGVTPYQFIEKVGRTCYKSEDLITPDSAEKFVRGLVNRHHHAMLEHWTLYFCLSSEFFNDLLDDLTNYNVNLLKYFNVTKFGVRVYMSGSFRSFIDLFVATDNCKMILKPFSALTLMRNCLLDQYPLIFDWLTKLPIDKIAYNVRDCVMFENQVEFKIKVLGYCGDKANEVLKHHLTHTFLFTTDRGVTHELVRHRPASFAQESTRYCNYSKGKFGGEITVILPFFFDTGMGTSSNSLVYEAWKYSCEVAERKYFELLNYGATPQEARSVLPNSLKTDIIMTATEEEWQHVVNLRYHGTTGAPHPQMLELMTLAMPQIIENTEGRVN